MAPGPQATHIKPNSDGSVTVEYVATDSGPHDFNATHNDKSVSGTPLRINVDSSNGKYVTAYGPGLVQGGSGETLDFHVTGSSKDLDVKISGPGQTEILKKEEKGGTVHVEYRVMSPGEYNVNVLHKGKPIHGSPFTTKISGEGRKRSQVSLPATSEYNLGGADVDFTNMVAVLKAPSGSTEPCLLKRMTDGRLGIASFQPKSKGTYEVIVTQDGKAIAGSPFKINVGESNVCSPLKVKVTGAVKSAVANKWNDVTINIEEAGYGSLGVSVEGGHRSNVELKPSGKVEYHLRYKPHEPGVYLINIKFGDDHVAGSSFLVSVGGDASGRSRETVTKEVKAVDPAMPGQSAHLELKIPGTDPLEMEATITSPSGKTEACELRGLPEDLCSIKLTPKEEGINTISLKFKGIHFAGSPFQYTVGKIASGGPHKVEFGGPGVEQGEVDSKNEFNIYYREAGPGTLSISIEGPSKAQMEVVDKGNGYVTVGYIVSAEGEYGVHIKFNDEHIPDSPVTVKILPMSRDAKKIVIIGLRDRGLEPNRPVTFSVQMNGAFGDLKAELSTPSGTEEDVHITELDEDKFALRFVPHENGIFYINVKFNEAHIPGSPIPILIGKHASDPALVFAKGSGLEKGVVGKPASFEVVTLNAGAGTLAVHIEGPSKAVLACKEGTEGYEFSYTPAAPGAYMIMIKYSNITIAGAPFKATVTGEGKASGIKEISGLFVETVEKKPGQASAKRFHGDASRVVAQGNGLKKGLANRPCAFTLDFKDAGQALLRYGIISPTGNPVTQISLKKAKPTTYNVTYTPLEKGEHTLVIAWGPDEIPGSPFTIPVS